MSHLMQSPTLLVGDNTIPGVKIPADLLKKIPEIIQACRDFGLDFYETVVELCRYDEISELASFGGFPVRYPHWRFGQEYEEMSKGYQHGMHRIYEMVINCLKSHSVIVTGRGSIQVKDVQVGDKVYTAGGSRNVVAVVKQPLSPTLLIKLRGYGHDLGCTPNHKWLTVTEEGPKWVEARHLQVGDLLIGGDAYHTFRNSPAKWNWSIDKVIDNTRPSIRHCVKSIYPPQEMTLELAELLGACLGDGSIGVKSYENHISVCVDKKNKRYVQHLASLFNKVFNHNKPEGEMAKEAVIQEFRVSVDNVLFSSKAAVDFFDYIGATKGCTYKDKRIPWSIWQSSSEYRAAFLRGLFDTDGSAGNSIEVSFYNHEFARDVQLLLAELGIKSNLSRVDNDYNNISTIKVVGLESVYRFQERIGFALDYKDEKLTNRCEQEVHGSGGKTNHQLCNLVRKSHEKYAAKLKSRSWEKLLKQDVCTNRLHVMVIEAALQGCEEFQKLYQDIFQYPLWEVESIEEGGNEETIDIALDVGHDFIANGVMSHNTNPCYIYCLDSNSMVDHITVIAHATGHNDFFKNNIFFSPTSQNMMNELANHGSRIRRYMSKWGKENVTRFIDKCLSLDMLIDPSAAWLKRKIKEPIIEVKREYHYPRRLRVQHDYMEDWINDKEYLDHERRRIYDMEIRESLGIFENPTKDIFGFIKDNAPLQHWQHDIACMLHEEAMYFAPQRQTKMINEGWASYVDSQIMARYGYAEGGSIFDYAAHKAGVLGGKYSQNPYKLGYMLFMEIEDRWNKGKFGRDYEECADVREKEKWNKRLGLGHEKVFETRQYYDDVTMLAEFFDQEFCEKYRFFRWQKFPDGTYKIVDRDSKSIKKLLIQQRVNGGLPDIKLVDPNHKGQRIFLMEHNWDGRILHPGFTKDTLLALASLWRGQVALVTKDKDGRPMKYSGNEDKIEASYLE